MRQVVSSSKVNYDQVTAFVTMYCVQILFETMSIELRSDEEHFYFKFNIFENAFNRKKMNDSSAFLLKQSKTVQGIELMRMVNMTSHS